MTISFIASAAALAVNTLGESEQSDGGADVRAIAYDMEAYQ